MNEGLVLSVLAALVLGGYLVVVKQYFSHYPPPLFVVLAYLSGMVWYLPFVAVTVPAEAAVPTSLSLSGGLVLLGTAVFTALALLSFYHALAVGDVSYVAPISKIVPVFVLPLEVLLLQQRLTALQVAGVAVATAAVYVANYRSGSLLDPLREIRRSRAALFALGSAAAFGVVDVGKRVSMQELDVAPETFVVVMLVTVSVLLAPVAVQYRDAVDWRGDLGLLLGTGLVMVTGQHLVAAAFETLPASVVSPVVNTQAVVAVVLGGLLLKESHLRTRLVAAALAVGGITLITLG